ncbi:caspase family protein [Hyella patelloides]|nr:caspase family protein [Hyella patelloides]
MDRRTFLQQAALALVSVGVSETGINLLSKNSRFGGWLKPYIETLAQSTNRKLALLVGINEYSHKAHLHGCVNDVELQKELLIHRFGFKPQDIFTLKDRKATRENIETAFIEHLREQVADDDVVLFHFSGYGSQVKIDDDKLANSLVPIDANIPNKGNPAANDLLQDTLFYLGRSLKTDNLIAVLDTSFQTTKEILQGNFRVRSDSEVAERPSPEELAFQSQLQRNLAGQGIPYSKESTNPGILLSAAEQNQIALEGTWDNFSAGLLTYALTEYLWQTTPKTNIQVALQQTANSVSSWSEKQQQPKVTGKIKSDLANNALAQQSPGEGFVKSIDSKGMVNLQLTALSFALLDAYQEESCFTLAESTENNMLQLRSREGIMAKAQLLKKSSSVDKDSLVNQSVQEAIRILPRNLGLNVALDNHLERIERVDATSAFANVPSIKAAATAGEDYADCLLGKIPLMVDKKIEGDSQSTEKSSHSYGLYTPRGKLILNTPGEAKEVVKLAVSRLEPYFNKLLAAKWLELTVNDNSSTIPVSATLELVGKNYTLIEKNSLRAATKLQLKRNIPTLERSSEIKLKIDNQSDRDLYGIIVGVDSEEQFITLYTPQKLTAKDKNTIPDNLKIAAKNQIAIPQNSKSWKWKVSQPLGIAKIYLILGIKPFANTLDLVSQQPTVKSDGQQIFNLSNPLEIATAILQDLHGSSAVNAEIISSTTDVYALDVNNWTSLQFVYDVV